MDNKKLEERLIGFSIKVFKICQASSNSEFILNIYNQLSRSATSSALNYGEARGAESKKDFIHKQRITLKELRESYISLQILDKTDVFESDENLISALTECNELIAISVTSIRTAERTISKSKSEF